MLIWSFHSSVYVLVVDEPVVGLLMVKEVHMFLPVKIYLYPCLVSGCWLASFHLGFLLSSFNFQMRNTLTIQEFSCGPLTNVVVV